MKFVDLSVVVDYYDVIKDFMGVCKIFCFLFCYEMFDFIYVDLFIMEYKLENNYYEFIEGFVVDVKFMCVNC